jgi:hypothetical protein
MTINDTFPLVITSLIFFFLSSYITEQLIKKKYSQKYTQGHVLFGKLKLINENTV